MILRNWGNKMKSNRMKFNNEKYTQKKEIKCVTTKCRMIHKVAVCQERPGNDSTF